MLTLSKFLLPGITSRLEAHKLSVEPSISIHLSICLSINLSIYRSLPVNELPHVRLTRFIALVSLLSCSYVVLQYNTTETFNDTLDDVIGALMIRELIDWAGSDPVIKHCTDTEVCGWPSPVCVQYAWALPSMRRISPLLMASTSLSRPPLRRQRVYLCGHSRGGKLATLAAVADNRVAALFLMDPVDNTVYAPLGPDYPSAVAALGTMEEDRYLRRRKRYTHGHLLLSEAPSSLVTLSGSLAPMVMDVPCLNRP